MGGKGRGGKKGGQTTPSTPNLRHKDKGGSAGSAELETSVSETPEEHLDPDDDSDLNPQNQLMMAKIRQLVRREVLEQLSDTVKELKVVEKKINDKVETLEKKIDDVAASLQTSVADLKSSATKLKTETIPSLVTHMNSMLTHLALQNIDANMHRRKWSLIFQGVPGNADEPSDETRKAVIEVAKKNLKLRDNKDSPISSDHFAACHRLKSQAGSAIIARFVDLKQRDRWLAHAKHLAKSNISMSVDVPPCLRKAKNQLMAIRKDFAPDDKKRSFIKHLPSWPYLVLHRKGEDDIHHTFSKGDIIRQAIKLPEEEKVMYELSAG